MLHLGRPTFLRCWLVPFAALTLAGAARGAITTTGEVAPADPNAWDPGVVVQIGETTVGGLTIDGGSSAQSGESFLGAESGASGTTTVTGAGSAWVVNHHLHVGENGSGVLNVLDGATVSNARGYLGNLPGSFGAATVSGAGSSWTSEDLFYVGRYGSGTLLIEDGGAVASGTTWVALRSDTAGAVVVTGAGSSWEVEGGVSLSSGEASLQIADGATVAAESVSVAPGATGSNHILFDNGVLNTGGLTATRSQLRGTGVINSNGILADIDVVFDASTGLQQQLLFDSEPGQNITINLDLANGSSGPLGAGYYGQSSLTIADGLVLSSSHGIIGGGDNGDGSAVVTGAGTTWANSRSLYVARTGTGELSILDGATVNSSNAYVAWEQDMTGTAIVSGAGSLWEVRETLAVGSGRGSNGIVTVSDGGVIQSVSGVMGDNSGSRGDVVLGGAGSRWLNSAELVVGKTGAGSLEVRDGASATTASAAIGSAYRSSGSVTVSGVGSVMSVESELIVGRFGAGELSIAAGASVGAGSATIGYGDPGEVLVAGEGSSWTSSDRLTIGRNSLATLRIEDGAVVEAASVWMGEHQLGDGELIVTGPASRLVTNLLRVGAEGQAAVTVNDGASIVTRATAIGASFEGSPDAAYVATVSGSGATWVCSDGISISALGTADLFVDQGGLVQTGEGQIGFSPDRFGGATISGTGSKWLVDEHLGIGAYGHGTLFLVDGGAAEVGTDTLLGEMPGGDGFIHFDGGTLSTGGLVASLDDLTGVGAIETRGLVSDRSLTFDSPSMLTQQFQLNGQPGQDIEFTLDITGDDTRALGVGYRTSGTIQISGGVELNSSDGYFGYHEGAEGAATVTGAGSLWRVDDTVYVGLYGGGDLTIENGAAVESDSVWIARHSDSIGDVRLDGAASTLTVLSDLYVGMYGDGVLSISNGAVLHSGSSAVGRSANSGGQVTVSGPGSRWLNRGVMTLGDDGLGVLTISDGGGVEIGSAGAPRDLNLGFDRGEGVLRLNDGGVLRLYNGSIRQSRRATFDFDGGRLEGVGVYDVGEGLTQNGGVLAPGNSAGVTTIVGDYNLVAGVLEIELLGDGGVAGTDFDQLIVTGGATLGVLAELDLLLGYAPEIGQSFLIVDNAAPVSGAFANGGDLTADHGVLRYRFAIDYAAGDEYDIALTADSVSLIGDYNGDGAVDSADYTVWRDAASSGSLAADGNLDGVVDSRDYDLWFANFGLDIATATAAAAAAVPEPSAALLVTLLLLSVGCRRRSV